MQTGEPTAAELGTRTAAHPLPDAPPHADGFVPGSIVAGRYRLLMLLGKGGMGEVWRADDLKLQQSVALKFLPSSRASDPGWLARFRDEVKLAHRVTHPNVCRVHDIGEALGRPFLSMEYVDGEDLSSLLRRIGRLPVDKAVDLLRQLCAGLAAAHENGVLHRDLKPANVMIDGRGRARLTDFGIAALADSNRPGHEAGTPAYMAPELFDGAPATVRSDLYALGLVAFEMLTGRHAFTATTLHGMVREQKETTPPSLATLTPGLPPQLEVVVLRCLEKDPALRPSSAAQIASALPRGGDLLDQAVAAGETPSPDLVAAGGIAAAPLWQCWTLLGIVVAALAVLWTSGGRAHVLGRVGAVRSAELLTEDARRHVRALASVPVPENDAVEIRTHPHDLEWLKRQGPAGARALEEQRPAPLTWRYRGVQGDITPHRGVGVTPWDPPPTPGDVVANVDFAGRLVDLRAVSAPNELPPVTPADVFAALGLNLETFREVPATFVPEVHVETKRAWEGAYGPPGSTVTVEAGFVRDRLAWLVLRGPWTPPSRTHLHDAAGQSAVLLLLLLAAFALMWRNVRQRRGDLRGAGRVAGAGYVATVVTGLLVAHHTLDAAGELDVLTHVASRAAGWAATLFALYLALEPLMRRFWPHLLVSWSRLLAGRWTDPLVARDVLGGCALGLLGVLTIVGRQVLPERFGGGASVVMPPTALPLLGPLPFLGSLLGSLPFALQEALVLPFLLVLLRLLLRRRALVLTAFFVLSSLPGTMPDHWVEVVLRAVNAVCYTLAVLVFGPVGILAGNLAGYLALDLPLGASGGFRGLSIFSTLLIVALAGWSFAMATRGRLDARRWLDG